MALTLVNLPVERACGRMDRPDAAVPALWAGSRGRIRPIDSLVFYARNPRKNDAAVDRMCASIREFGRLKHPPVATSG